MKLTDLQIEAIKNDKNPSRYGWKTMLLALIEENGKLEKALHTEQQIVQAFYEYRDECCFAHCEAWMLEKGHRVIVNGQSEWKNEAE